MYVLPWVVRSRWWIVGPDAHLVALLQPLIEPVNCLPEQSDGYLVDVCAVFPPTAGFFLLIFCNTLADCIVLPNKHYYYYYKVIEV